MNPKTQQTWEEFLNPDVMRPRLIVASVYIAGFQALKESIVDHIRSFFVCGFDQQGDKIDPKYETDVLSRSKSPVYASLDWLKHMGAIDDSDVATFDRVKKCRNALSHSLLSIIGGTEKTPPDVHMHFHEMIALLRKIEVWWIREVEIPTNPDFDGKEVNDNDINPGRVLGLQLLCTIALGDEANSRQFHEWFRGVVAETKVRGDQAMADS